MSILFICNYVCIYICIYLHPYIIYIYMYIHAVMLFKLSSLTLRHCVCVCGWVGRGPLVCLLQIGLASTPDLSVRDGQRRFK